MKFPLTPSPLQGEVRWGRRASARRRHGDDAGDAIKATMAGAVVCHLCSALLQKGPGHIGKLQSGLAEWLEAHEYHSLRQMLGSMSLVNCPDPAALERANYLQALYSWESP